MTASISKKSILVLTDFSPSAYKALEYAQFIFKEVPTHFHLLHLYTPAIIQSRFMASSIASDALEDLALVAAKKGLSAQLSCAKSKGASVSHSFSAAHSFNLIVPATIEAVSEKKYDLLVMGSKGHSGLASVFMGSQTLKLIKAGVQIPILAVPEKVVFERPTSFAFATDFSRFFAAAELAPLIGLAKDFKASIQIVQVKDDSKLPSAAQQFNIRMLHNYLAELSFEEHRILGIHNIARSLGTFIEENGIHLMAFLNYHHSFIEWLSKEAIAKKLLRISSSPLVVLPELSMTHNSYGKQRKDFKSPKKESQLPNTIRHS